ncbi:hypothetical protein SGPA1_10957 [Streptomyces misionensis JCM 4497]
MVDRGTVLLPRLPVRHLGLPPPRAEDPPGPGSRGSGPPSDGLRRGRGGRVPPGRGPDAAPGLAPPGPLVGAGPDRRTGGPVGGPRLPAGAPRGLRGRRGRRLSQRRHERPGRGPGDDVRPHGDVPAARHVQRGPARGVPAHLGGHHPDTVGPGPLRGGRGAPAPPAGGRPPGPAARRLPTAGHHREAAETPQAAFLDHPPHGLRHDVRHHHGGGDERLVDPVPQGRGQGVVHGGTAGHRGRLRDDAAGPGVRGPLARPLGRRSGGAGRQRAGRRGPGPGAVGRRGGPDPPRLRLRGPGRGRHHPVRLRRRRRTRLRRPVVGRRHGHHGPAGGPRPDRFRGGRGRSHPGYGGGRRLGPGGHPDRDLDPLAPARRPAGRATGGRRISVRARTVSWHSVVGRKDRELASTEGSLW